MDVQDVIMTERQEKKLIDYLGNLDSTKKLVQILEDLRIKETYNNIENLISIIDSLTFIIFDKDKVVPKAVALRNLPLRIHPQDEEVVGNYLILGHRILPFNNHNLKIDSFTLIYKNKPIERIKKPFKKSEIHKFYNLLSFEYLPFLDQMTDIDNSKDPEEFFKTEVYIDTYDMKVLFHDTSFKFGDTLILKIVNYEKGIYEVSVDNETEREEVMDANKAFLKSLYGILDDNYYSAEQQLLYSFYYARKKIKSVPAFSIGKLLSVDDTIKFSSFPNGNVMIHYKDEDINEKIFEENVYDTMSILADPSELNSIDAILRYIGNNYTSDHVKAVILDQLSFDKFDYNTMLDFIFKNKTNAFSSDEILETKFKKLVEKEYVKVKSSFDKNPTPLPANILRRKLLEKTSVITCFLRELDENQVEIDSLPKKEMMELAALNGHIDSMIFFFNKNKIKPGDIERLDETEEFINEIDWHITESIKSIRRLIKK